MTEQVHSKSDQYQMPLGADIPVDTSPVGTPNDFDRSVQAAQLPSKASAPSISASPNTRILVFVGQLLIGGALLGSGVLFTQGLYADPLVVSVNAAQSTATLILWIGVGVVFLLGVALLVQAWRVQRTVE